MNSSSIVIVTGVTKNGYGAEIARVLALVGAKVILAGRELNKFAESMPLKNITSFDILIHRIEETAEIIKNKTPNANLRKLVFDLGSQQAVRNAAAEVLRYPEPIDVLILNAAIVSAPILFFLHA